jgi:hypothetical protein
MTDTALNSFKNAEDGCIAWLCDNITSSNYEVGENALLDDEIIDPTLINLFVFSISGGPEQAQNYGIPAPGPGWYAFAGILGQFEEREQAVAFLGEVQNIMPPERADGSAGIEPNVCNFEIIEHPEIASRPLFSDEGERVSRVWNVRIRCRVVYYNNET